MGESKTQTERRPGQGPGRQRPHQGDADASCERKHTTVIFFFFCTQPLDSCTSKPPPIWSTDSKNPAPSTQTSTESPLRLELASPEAHRSRPGVLFCWPRGPDGGTQPLHGPRGWDVAGGTFLPPPAAGALA